MRRSCVVAGVVLIAILAAVAVPGSAGSRGPHPDNQIDPNLVRSVEAVSFSGAETTTPTPDPAYRSDGALDPSAILLDPDTLPAPTGRPVGSFDQPDAPRGVIVVPTWHLDRDISWYGPGFYGKRTACGQAVTTSLVGVANRTLPCGTLVTFRNPANGRVVTAAVVDRGPYVSGRQWDMTPGLCAALGHCYTGTIYWKLH